MPFLLASSGQKGGLQYQRNLLYLTEVMGYKSRYKTLESLCSIWKMHFSKFSHPHKALLVNCSVIRKCHRRRKKSIIGDIFNMVLSEINLVLLTGEWLEPKITLGTEIQDANTLKYEPTCGRSRPLENNTAVSKQKRYLGLRLAPVLKTIFIYLLGLEAFHWEADNGRLFGDVKK